MRNLKRDCILNPEVRQPNTRPELGQDLVRQAEPGDRCYECGAQIAGTVTERRVSAQEIRFYCEFCQLDPDAPLPIRVTGQCTDDQKLQLFIAGDEELCQLVASNSGRNGDKTLVTAAVQEIERRVDLQQAIDELNRLAEGVRRG